MWLRILLVFCLYGIFCLPSYPAFGNEISPPTDSTCLQCHAAKQTGFSSAHAFAPKNCVTCHAGNNQAVVQDESHNGLIAFPGDLANAHRACGTCHAERVASVADNLMHSGKGIVDVTRRLLDGHPGPDDSVNFQSLGHGVADSMLRKLCASCHLGQAKTEQGLDVMHDRGGGCLACHVNDYPEDAHPALTTRVSDGRCFGCHSRSGRISLSYTGLAEVDTPAKGDGLRLPDGRPVEQKVADVHYRAGMACIDCHTSVGLMGASVGAGHQRDAVDIECSDCHDNRQQKVGYSDWPAELNSMKKHVPFAANDDTDFLITRRNNTPLWNIELRSDGAWLHTKNTGLKLRIPEPGPATHSNDGNHERLACATCHSQWAPQCFGCHMDYDADGSQWDHVERAVTAGRWNERRWHIRNEPGTLGVNDDGRIELFVPGMIMTIAHPDLDVDKFLRVFAPLSPHTTGQSRSCESCHRSSVALGLGEGEFTDHDGEVHFQPVNDPLQDGLPADAWTNLERSLGGDTPVPGHRPLSRDEMNAIIDSFVTRDL
ncbi:MAG: hypothetical protein ACR2QX_15260 [Woeseiaceae bacterium]